MQSTEKRRIYSYSYIIYIYMCVLDKAPRRVCIENIALGDVSRDKYSTRRSRVLYLSLDTPPRAIFSIQTRLSGALTSI